MNQVKSFCSPLLAAALLLFSAASCGEEVKRAWQTSICSNFRLSLWDRMNSGGYVARYTVTAADGTVFVAEKKGSADPDASEVIFPDNFVDSKTRHRAWVNCSNGESYTWNIYADATLVDSGTLVLSRKKRK